MAHVRIWTKAVGPGVGKKQFVEVAGVVGLRDGGERINVAGRRISTCTIRPSSGVLLAVRMRIGSGAVDTDGAVVATGENADIKDTHLVVSPAAYYPLDAFPSLRPG